MLKNSDFNRKSNYRVMKFLSKILWSNNNFFVKMSVWRFEICVKDLGAKSWNLCLKFDYWTMNCKNSHFWVLKHILKNIHWVFKFVLKISNLRFVSFKICVENLKIVSWNLCRKSRFWVTLKICREWFRFEWEIWVEKFEFLS